MQTVTRNIRVETALAAERAPGGTTGLFAVRNLSVLAYAQGFTLWHYKAPALFLDQVKAKGFFDPAADMLAVGDMVLVSVQDGGAVLFINSASEKTGVVVAPLAG